MPTFFNAVTQFRMKVLCRKSKEINNQSSPTLVAFAQLIFLIKQVF